MIFSRFDIRRRLSMAVLAVVSAVGLMGAEPALAAAHAGKVIFAFGEVSASSSGGERRALVRGDRVVGGDTIITGRGRAQVRLTDGGFVALNPNTEYAIEEYDFEPAPASTGRSFFNLIRGGVRLVTGTIGRANRANWRMRTSVATIGIRGSGGYFRYVKGRGDAPALAANVAFGGFTATDDLGNRVDLGPETNWICDPGCAPGVGPGEEEDLTFVEVEVPDEPFNSGERPIIDILGEDPFAVVEEPIVVVDEGPILPGPAPDGTHISVAFSFIDTGSNLNSLADGEETDGGMNNAEFGTLEHFEWFTGFPCEPCIFDANGGEEIVDPAPDGSTFNDELGAEWGRVVDKYTLDTVDQKGQFHYVASIDPTPPSQLPTSGTLIYDEDFGGSLATHTFGLAGDTEVADQRTNVRIVVDYGNGGNIDDFRVSSGFPSGTTFVLQSNKPTTHKITDGFLFFNSSVSTITVPSGSVPSMVTGSTMCAGGCTFFGTTVFGPAGPNAIGVTGTFQGNTAQPSYPAHSVAGGFVVKH